MLYNMGMETQSPTAADFNLGDRVTNHADWIGTVTRITAKRVEVTWDAGKGCGFPTLITPKTGSLRKIG
jgi:malonyl CoA-acyl carrier protein transacylase